MTLYDEIYFEITLSGSKSELKRFIAYLKSGELDDFFEVDADYIFCDDNYQDASDDEECSMVFTNDDYGIEVDSLDVDEFLEIFCRAAKTLDARGRLYDADDEEYSFVSREGDSYYLNADRLDDFNDELDAHAKGEEENEEKDEEED